MSCIWGIEGCNCWAGDNDFAGILGGELPTGFFTLEDLGLSLDEPVQVEDDTLARVIAEVRQGLLLFPEEAQVLLDALVDEERAHAETLADAYDLEDELDERDERIAELEAVVAEQNALLGLAQLGLGLAMDTILGQATENETLRLVVDVQNGLLETLVRQMERDALAREFALRLGYLA